MNILMDLDGTLTDPREGIVACIRHALEGVGHECPPDSEMLSYIGPPLHDSFGMLFGAGEAKKIARAIELYRERFSTVGMFENGVYPGIPEALAALQAPGVRLFVATSKPRIYAERIVEHYGLARYFGRVYGAELDGTRSKKADLIAHVLSTEALTPQETCMVGDRMHDMTGARANGVLPIGVLWGYGSREELLAAGAALLCEQPSNLATIPETMRTSV
jgi:phosphoglycolate phosphatase